MKYFINCCCHIELDNWKASLLASGLALTSRRFLENLTLTSQRAGMAERTHLSLTWPGFNSLHLAACVG